MPTEDGYDDPQKAGENVALNANWWGGTDAHDIENTLGFASLQGKPSFPPDFSTPLKHLICAKDR